jgi:hypothetical protein
MEIDVRQAILANMREGNFNFVARDYTLTDYGRTGNKRLLNVDISPASTIHQEP